MKKTSILLFFVVLTSSFLFAQNDNWSGEFKLGGSYYKGNINKMDMRSIGSISHKDSTFEFATKYKTIYGMNNGEENNREFSSIANFDWRPYSIISPFIAFSAYHNIYKGYDLRITGVGGTKFAYTKPNFSYSLSLAGLYSIEKYTAPSNPEDEVRPDSEIFRLSARPKIKYKLGKTVYFEHYTFYQPNVHDFSDYMIESRTSITNKLTKILFMDLSFEYEYMSLPPSTDIKKEDLAFVVSLVVKL